MFYFNYTHELGLNIIDATEMVQDNIQSSKRVA